MSSTKKKVKPKVVKGKRRGDAHRWWDTAGGQRVAIEAMGDDHLLNCDALVERSRVREKLARLEQKARQHDVILAEIKRRKLARKPADWNVRDPSRCNAMFRSITGDEGREEPNDESGWPSNPPRPVVVFDAAQAEDRVGRFLACRDMRLVPSYLDFVTAYGADSSMRSVPVNRIISSDIRRSVVEGHHELVLRFFERFQAQQFRKCLLGY